MSGWPLQGNPLLAAAERGASVGDRMLRLHYLTAHWIGPGQAADGCSCGQAGCPAPTEHPIKPDWFQAATADLWMVRARWLHHPRANLAVVTGERFDVLACDQATGRIALGMLPEPLGPVAWTGGGRLLIFTRSGLDAGLLHCDQRAPARWVYRHGRGSYVPLPRAQHASGRLADWVYPAGLPLPGWAEVQRVLVEAAWRLQAHGRPLAAGQRARWALVGLVATRKWAGL